jgi:hypothetical protein
VLSRAQRSSIGISLGHTHAYQLTLPGRLFADLHPIVNGVEWEIDLQVETDSQITVQLAVAVASVLLGHAAGHIQVLNPLSSSPSQGTTSGFLPLNTNRTRLRRSTMRSFLTLDRSTQGRNELVLQ